MICGWYGVGAHGECLHLDSVPALTADAVKGIPPQNMAPLLQSNYPTHLLYTIALGFVKTSILFSTCTSITANTHDGRSTSSWPSLLSYPLQRFFSCFRLCPAFLVLGSRGTNGSSREMLESTHTADVLQPQRHLQYRPRCQHILASNTNAVEFTDTTPAEACSWSIVQCRSCCCCR
jgi:hypothetical protein